MARIYLLLFPCNKIYIIVSTDDSWRYDGSCSVTCENSNREVQIQNNKKSGVVIPRVITESCKSKVKNAGRVNQKEKKICIQNSQHTITFTHKKLRLRDYEFFLSKILFSPLSPLTHFES